MTGSGNYLIQYTKEQAQVTVIQLAAIFGKKIPSDAFV